MKHVDIEWLYDIIPLRIEKWESIHDVKNFSKRL